MNALMVRTMTGAGIALVAAALGTPVGAHAQYAQTISPLAVAQLFPIERKTAVAAGVVDDREITLRVLAALGKEKSVSGMGLRVKSTDGNVELTGSAGTQAQVDHAVSIASQVSGVKSVRSEVRVN